MAATESTTRIRWVLGGVPSSSLRPASAPIAVIVPIVSKKSARRRENTSSTAASTPVPGLAKAPNRSTWPKVSKDGSDTTPPPSAGTVSDQPEGFSADDAPMPPMASTSTATTVVTTIAMRIAPRTWRTHSATISARPRQKTRTGQPARCPSTPSWTGTVVPNASGMRVTTRASTKPISAMKSPIPTEMATLSCWGTAWNTARRNPVRTSARMMMPSRTTSPIAAPQVVCRAIEFATNALSPSPVARARGKLAKPPIAMVRTPATSAVPAAIAGMPLPGSMPPPRYWPVESGT